MEKPSKQGQKPSKTAVRRRSLKRWAYRAAEPVVLVLPLICLLVQVALYWSCHMPLRHGSNQTRHIHVGVVTCVVLRCGRAYGTTTWSSNVG
jgi:hypothetical protein